jgi:hypothetical protein
VKKNKKIILGCALTLMLSIALIINGTLIISRNYIHKTNADIEKNRELTDEELLKAVQKKDSSITRIWIWRRDHSYKNCIHSENIFNIWNWYPGCDEERSTGGYWYYKGTYAKEGHDRTAPLTIWVSDDRAEVDIMLDGS